MALRRLALRDFVIVHELELDLADGFTALTGETGAGKSILIDALQLALGARADAGAVREGASRTEVCAEFDATTAAHDWLAEAGFDVDDTLLLRRVVDAQGKSRAWINGSPATAAQLRELAGGLLDIHGQHAWQSLTRPAAVRALLDAYAGIDTQLLSRLWQRWRDAQNAATAARGAQDTLQQEAERLAWQIAEVDKLAPGSDEWESLSTAHTRLGHAQALQDAAREALRGLAGDADTAVQTGLARAHAMLHNQEHIEPEFSGLADVLASSLAQAQDVAHSLQAYLRRTDLDPDRLAELDARMSLWVTLARRYRRTPAELPAQWQAWKQELARLDQAADLTALEAAEQQAERDYLAEARGVSQARRQAAPRLAKAVTQAMQGLGMQGGVFDVAQGAAALPMQSGLDEIDFLVAGHPGSTPRPVAKIASGGELSRIALAIAVTTSRLGGAPTLIFDEVDAGIGGAVAATVGQLMKQLGRDRQVLAVTHLPQVAACADQHLVVAKQRRGAGIASSVAPVQGDARVVEVARMLGGEKRSGTSLAHAREMLAGGATAP
ncbi:MAG: DNA repair protein RecN [Burkholderiaceae bacterium]|nr:MAG: DNA repair protein RecN [Burkholderiaceae bacterium]